MIFDFTVNITSILLAILTVAVIPLIRLLITTLVELRDTVNTLNIKMGNGHPPSGVLGDVELLKEETREHRDWLIGIRDRHEEDRRH